jgi:hypothetical protein
VPVEELSTASRAVTAGALGLRGIVFPAHANVSI